MQQTLPLDGLTAAAPLAWNQLAPGEQIEAIAVLARLMTQLVQPTHQEEHNDD